VREIKDSEPLIPEGVSLWQIIGQLRDALYIMDLSTGELVCANSACEAITGFTQEELQSMGIEQVRQRIHPQDRERFWAGMREMEASHKSQILEYRWQHKDGRYRWFQDSSSLLRDEQGRPQALVGTLRDITWRKETEEALRESSQRLRRVIENSLDGIEQVNLETHTFEVISPSMERLTGFTREELVALGAEGKAARVHPDHQQAFREYMTRAREHPEVLERPIVYLWRTKSGEWRWFSDNEQGVRNEQGQVEVIVSVTRDITDAKQAEKELRESEERLRRLNETLEERVRERTVRLRDMSLQMTRVEERARRRLAQVLHDHLQQLLAASRMQLNMLRGQARDESFVQVLDQVDRLLEESIDESRSLTAELSPTVLYSSGLSPALRWLAEHMQDRYNLQVDVEAEDLGNQTSEELRVAFFQAARELLFNVVKHAGVLRAQVRLRRLGKDALELGVSDQGSGMDVSQIEQQGESLGMFSIRERIEALGGRMEIDSMPGRGTRVTLTAPLHLAEREQPPASPQEEEEAEPKAVRVLLADDHTIVRQGLARLLEEEPDIELVAEADSGRAAVDLAHTTHPDVVLMDVSMPDMDGVEATQRILADQPDTRVIGLSMYEQDTMSAKMRQVGAVDYVSKGGDPTELVETVRRVGQRKEPQR